MPRRAAAYVREEPEGLSSKELNTDTLEGEQHLPHAPLAAHHHQAVVVHYVTVLRHGELPVGERGFVRLGRPQQRSGPAARRLAARRPVPHLLQPRGRSRICCNPACGQRRYAEGLILRVAFSYYGCQRKYILRKTWEDQTCM